MKCTHEMAVSPGHPKLSRPSPVLACALPAAKPPPAAYSADLSSQEQGDSCYRSHRLQEVDREGEGGPFCLVIITPLCPRRGQQWKWAGAEPSLSPTGVAVATSHRLPPKGLAGKKDRPHQSKPEETGVSPVRRTYCHSWWQQRHSRSKQPRYHGRGAAAPTSQKPFLLTWHQKDLTHHGRTSRSYGLRTRPMHLRDRGCQRQHSEPTGRYWPEHRITLGHTWDFWRWGLGISCPGD